MRRLSLWLAALMVAGCSPPPPPEAEVRALHEQLDRLESAVEALGATYDTVAHVYRTEVLPIERALSRRARSTAMARRVAWAIRNEARRTGVPASLIAGVMQVENPWLIPDTASWAGAVGLMQVMPFHAPDSRHGCETNNLEHVESNVCYGVGILSMYLRLELETALRRALLRYNGCVRTAGCEVYAERVMNMAAAASGQTTPATGSRGRMVSRVTES
jgi:soluble lytic murein transglycosylase-like protein